MSGFDSSPSAIAPAPGSVEAIFVTYFNDATMAAFPELFFFNPYHSQAYSPFSPLVPVGPDVGSSYLYYDPYTGRFIVGTNAFSGSTFLQSGVTLLSRLSGLLPEYVFPLHRLLHPHAVALRDRVVLVGERREGERELLVKALHFAEPPILRVHSIACDLASHRP
jgi:hypothetical protein